MKKTYVISAKRTAIGSFLGSLAAVQPKVMGSTVVKALLEDAKVAPEQVDELICGNVLGAGLGQNIARTVALEAGISDGMLYRWVRKYEIWGYTGRVDVKKGRPPKEPKMKHTEINTLAPLTESEREELIRLRAEIEYIKAENEVIKKEIALREEKQAALLKAKKQQSSKNFEKKDIS